MQVVVAFFALPLVALLMALATRLEDGLRPRAAALAPAAPLALTAGHTGGLVAPDEPALPPFGAVDLADAEAPASSAV